LDAPLAQVLRCRGRRDTGRSCQNVIGVWHGPLLTTRIGGRECGDPAWVRCEKCGSITYLRAGADGETPVVVERRKAA
jgi:hypothetical protein